MITLEKIIEAGELAQKLFNNCLDVLDEHAWVDLDTFINLAKEKLKPKQKPKYQIGDKVIFNNEEQKVRGVEKTDVNYMYLITESDYWINETLFD
jgi:hypothetical protein